ncbi:MAG: heme-binding protein, partial [Bacteroidota bacterium]
PVLFSLVKSASEQEVRMAALRAIAEIKADNLNAALEKALSDRESEVRALALKLVPDSGLEEHKAVALFQKILQQGTIKEQQAAYTALGTLRGEAAVDLLESALLDLMEQRAAPEVQLDVLEAIRAQADEALLAQLENYEAAKDQDNPLEQYREALAGGTAWKGREIFYRNEAAQCVRCHAVFEHGGNAGPGLAGVADRLTTPQLLEAIVAPSARYAAGYEVAILKMKDGESISGIVTAETDEMIQLKVGEDEQTVSKADVEKRQPVPSSMPLLTAVLDKRQIRDLVAFLGTLRVES